MQKNTHPPILAHFGVPLKYNTLFIWVKVPKENTDPSNFKIKEKAIWLSKQSGKTLWQLKYHRGSVFDVMNMSKICGWSEKSVFKS